jgi:hypothetical protein
MSVLTVSTLDSTQLASWPTSIDDLKATVGHAGIPVFSPETSADNLVQVAKNLIAGIRYTTRTHGELALLGPAMITTAVQAQVQASEVVTTNIKKMVDEKRIITKNLSAQSRQLLFELGCALWANSHAKEDGEFQNGTFPAAGCYITGPNGELICYCVNTLYAQLPGARIMPFFSPFISDSAIAQIQQQLGMNSFTRLKESMYRWIVSEPRKAYASDAQKQRRRNERGLILYYGNLASELRIPTEFADRLSGQTGTVIQALDIPIQRLEKQIQLGG